MVKHLPKWAIVEGPSDGVRHSIKDQAANSLFQVNKEERIAGTKEAELVALCRRNSTYGATIIIQ